MLLAIVMCLLPSAALLLLTPTAIIHRPGAANVHRRCIRSRQTLAVATGDEFPLSEREALGIEGRRACIIFYADDESRRVAETFSLFEQAASDFRARGCPIVAVPLPGATPDRFYTDGTPDLRDVPTLADSYPSITFVTDFVVDVDLRAALGLPDSWSDPARRPYSTPTAFLLDPNGTIREVADEATSSKRPSNLWGAIAGTLADITYAPTADGDAFNPARSFEEDERARAAAFDESSRRAEMLKADPSLQGPTRGWFDGLGKWDGPPLLPAVGGTSGTIDSQPLPTGYAAPEPPPAPASPVKMPAWMPPPPPPSGRKAQSFGDIFRIGVGAMFGDDTPAPSPPPSPPPPPPPPPASPPDTSPPRVTEARATPQETSEEVAAAVTGTPTGPRDGASMARLRELEAKVGELEAEGISPQALEPLRQQLTELKLAALEAELRDLKGDLSGESGR